MATPETIGITTCGGCKRDADVKLNAGGFAYYHCGCGWSGRSHNASSSRRFIAEHVRPVNFGEPNTTPEAHPGEAGKPAPAAKKTQPAEPNPKAAEKPGFRFF